MVKGLDDLDLHLIRILQRDARTPFTHIATELEQPDTTVHFRTKKLIKNNIVSRFAALVCPEAFGYHDAALIKIEIGGHSLPVISEKRASTFAEELAEEEYVLWVALEKPNTIHATLIGEDENAIQKTRENIAKSPDVVNTVLIPLTAIIKGWELSGTPE